ncbi:hypothetical protein [uncultured Acinetobacter sp.]|uniref:hypothetical protein n=1 Tax=uncultured Acinetobacter sp. TaxID=165433 RepID=UPI002628EF61|nr:hypothetical protein [uncultured Acinetobacter sp.]
MITPHNRLWSLALPWLSLGILLIYLFLPQLFGIVILLSIGLIASVICAVHHAEVIAHKVGEPFGTLVLALSVTIIEVALIVSMMLSGGGCSYGLSPRYHLCGHYDYFKRYYWFKFACRWT